MWVMATDWPGPKVRSFLFGNYLLLLPFCLLLLTWTFGAGVPWAILYALMYFPVVFTGGQWGVRLGNRVSTARLRSGAYCLLTLTALSTFF